MTVYFQQQEMPASGGHVGTYLLGCCSLLHTSAERLRPCEAGRAGQTVVAWLCILAAMHAVKLKASIWNFLALFF